MKHKIFSFLLAFGLMMQAALIPAFAAAAEDPWDGFTTTSGNPTIANGTLTMHMGDEVRKTFTIDGDLYMAFDLSSTKYASDSGIQIFMGGNKRSFIQTGGNTSISVNDAGSWRTLASYNLTGTHHFEIYVLSDTTDLVIDGEYIGNYRNQTGGSWGNGFCFWAKNSETTTTVSNLEYRLLSKYSTGASAGSGASATQTKQTTSYSTDFSSVEDWSYGRTLVQNDGYVTLTATKDTGSMVLRKEVTVGDKFSISFRMRLENPEITTDRGASLRWKKHRIMLYPRNESVDIWGANGNGSYPADIGSDWHDYDVYVDGNTAIYYLDGKYLGTLALVNFDSGDSEYFQFWAINSDPTGSEIGISVDSVSISPADEIANISSPLSGARYLEGNPITLQATLTGSVKPDVITFYLDGEPVGEGMAPDYKCELDGLAPGTYNISATGEGLKEWAPSQFEVVRAVKGRVNATFASNNSISASLELYDKVDQVETVQWYLDGAPVNTTAANVTATLPVDTVGTHTVSAIAIAKDGASVKTTSATVAQEAGRDSLPGAKLASVYAFGYELTGTSGSATITGGDGYFDLNVTHTADTMTVQTDKGEQTFPLATGRWYVEVVSGVAEFYRDGVLKASVRLPRGTASGLTVQENGLSVANLRTRIVNKGAELFRQNNAGPINETTFDPGERYALELNGVGANDTIKIVGGKFRFELMSDGEKLSVASTIRTNLESQVYSHPLYEFAEGDENGYYRFVITNGLGQMFLNNEFVASFRLAPSNDEPAGITRETENAGAGLFVIRSLIDDYRFEDNFADTAQSEKYLYYKRNLEQTFTEEGRMQLTAADTGDISLHVYARDPIVSATVKALEETTGGVWIMARHCADAYNLKAGYNFETGAWEIRETAGDEVALAVEAGEFPIGQDVQLDLTVGDGYCILACNGVEVISSYNVLVDTHGRVGLIVSKGTVEVSHFSYEGDGAVNPSTEIFSFSGAGNSYDAVELNDGTILMGSGRASVWASTDRGHTWTRAAQFPVGMNAANIIRLQSGGILCINRVRDTTAPSEAYYDNAYVSYDNCQTFQGPYRIQPYSRNRISMNNKVVQLSDGRIYYASNEWGDGEETGGEFLGCYSDDDGKTWNISTNVVNTTNTDFWMQEPKTIELPDGTLRTYARNERGFLSYFESTDRGVSWDTTHIYSEFVSVMCAFNIERDPYEPNTYYMAWEYNNVNEDTSAYQSPRYRVGLAVSYDGCETWNYVGDMGEVDAVNPYASGRHMNTGIRVLEDCIIVNWREGLGFGRTAGSFEQWTPDCARVDVVRKADIVPMARFTQVHSLKRD